MGLTQTGEEFVEVADNMEALGEQITLDKSDLGVCNSRVGFERVFH